MVTVIVRTVFERVRSVVVAEKEATGNNFKNLENVVRLEYGRQTEAYSKHVQFVCIALLMKCL